METLDRAVMARAVFPALLGLDRASADRAAGAAAEGYPFPTNLDRDAPAPAADDEEVEVLRGGWRGGAHGRAGAREQRRRGQERAAQYGGAARHR